MHVASDAHRAISQVVTGLPSASLPSFSTTPIAASSSRMRSDSLKSFRARASLRCDLANHRQPGINSSTDLLARRPFCGSYCSKPQESRGKPPATPGIRHLRREQPYSAIGCSSEMAFGVFRSSHSASSIGGWIFDTVNSLASITSDKAYHSSKTFALSSKPFHRSSRSASDNASSACSDAALHPAIFAAKFLGVEQFAGS